MERAYKARAVMIPFASIDPLLNPLRTEPRFEAILRRVGHPESPGWNLGTNRVVSPTTNLGRFDN